LSNKRNIEWLIAESKLYFGNNLDYSASAYRDAKTKIKFRCKKHDYSFEQTSNNHLTSKHPCKFCLQESRRAVFSDSINTFKNKIQSIYGDLFDFENVNYVNQRTPVSLKCIKHNKVITKDPQVFLRGHGCDLCAKEESSTNLSKRTLHEINKFVSKLNGKCLSKTYLNNGAKLDFECSAGHKFQKSWSEIKNSLRWCSKCSPNRLIGETMARLMLEHLLKVKLPSLYIKQMDGLQLDGYNETQKVAFEYQGYQHFTDNSHFHQSDKRFEEQLKRDQYKKRLCKQNGITLIEILEFKTIRSGRIQLFFVLVQEKLRELNIVYSNERFELDLIELYRGRRSELYELAKEIVKKNNCKIQEFIGSESKHTYFCAKGHEIKNRNLSVIIKSNASCPHCDSERRFEELKNIIESKGGRILDRNLKTEGLSANYNWTCDQGHQSISKGQYLYRGFWCRTCQIENKKVKLHPNMIQRLVKDATSGQFYQKDIPHKYGIGSAVYRRIIKELKIQTNYLQQDRTAQTKRTNGRIVQISPNNLQIIKIYDCLEAVKNDEKGLFKPEGIRHQIKKYKKAYGYYWSKEEDLEETIKLIKTNTTNSK
jgi:hypothetical protein